jgi:hypothetical protein
MISFRDGRTFTEQPVGSNSIEQLLSIVNWRIEIRFLIICSDTRTLLRCKVGDNFVEPVAVIGIREPLPTTIDEGLGYHGNKACESEED